VTSYSKRNEARVFEWIDYVMAYVPRGRFKEAEAKVVYVEPLEVSGHV